MATFWRSRRRISHAWAPLSMSVNDDNFDCFSLKVHEIEIFFGFDFEISLRFYLVIFASKRNKAKRNSSLFSCFFCFFTFFTFFRFFSFNFRFTSIFSLNLSLQIFGVSHRSESCEIRFFFASKRNEIFASISNFASEAKVRAHPSVT